MQKFAQLQVVTLVYLRIFPLSNDIYFFTDYLYIIFDVTFFSESLHEIGTFIGGEKEGHSWPLAAPSFAQLQVIALVYLQEEEEEEVSRVLSPFDNVPSFGTNPVEDIP